MAFFFKDEGLTRDLVTVLEGANQTVPEFLQSSGGASSSQNNAVDDEEW